MTRFVVRRVVLGVLTLAVFLFALFMVIEIMIPGDVATPLRLGMTAQEVDELREAIGVTRPLPVRFWDWLTAFVTGNVTLTSFGNTTGEHVFGALPSTLLVFVIGLFGSYAFGTWLGRVTAWSPGLRTRPLTFLGVVAYTVFPPFLAFVLTWGLGPRLRGIRRSLFAERGDVWRGTSVAPNDVIIEMLWIAGAVWLFLVVARRLVRRYRRRHTPAGVMVVVGLAFTVAVVARRGIGWFGLDLVFDAALPMFGFAILSFGEFLLVSQTATGLSLGDDYVLTARAKGVSDREIRDRHVGRNAAVVVTTRLAVSLPYLLTGLVIIETALNYPGVGSFMFRAIESQDLPAVMTGLAVVGILALGIRLFLEMVSAWGDPRIRDGLTEAVTS